MARRAAKSSAKKRAKKRRKRAKKEKEDPLVRRREELILEVAHARVAMKAQGNKAVREATEPLMQDLRAVCTELEAKNRDELLKKLPAELWEKIVDENLHQLDLLALAMTCRFFGDTTKDLGKKVVTNLYIYSLVDLRKGEKIPSHTLDWFQWVCDTLLPGFDWGSKRVKGAVYEGDLVNYAALQGSVRWAMSLIDQQEEFSDSDSERSYASYDSHGMRWDDYF